MVAGLREHLNKKYQLVELNGEGDFEALSRACLSLPVSGRVK